MPRQFFCGEACSESKPVNAPATTRLHSLMSLQRYSARLRDPILRRGGRPEVSCSGIRSRMPSDMLRQTQKNRINSASCSSFREACPPRHFSGPNASLKILQVLTDPSPPLLHPLALPGDIPTQDLNLHPMLPHLLKPELLAPVLAQPPRFFIPISILTHSDPRIHRRTQAFTPTSPHIAHLALKLTLHDIRRQRSKDVLFVRTQQYAYFSLALRTFALRVSSLQ